MKKIGCILVFLYLMPLLSLKAVNAYPFPVSLKLPDGTSLAVRIYGDEHFSYRTTADGHFIAKGADGFYYYADWGPNGVLRPGELRAHDASARSAAEQMALAMRSKSVPPSVCTNWQNRRMRLSRSGEIRTQNGFPVQGSPKSLVLLVSFSDVKFQIPAADFDDMLNTPGYAGNGATGSARDYYSDNSNGLFTPRFVVFGPVQLPRNMAYYGQDEGSRHDIHAQDMVIDACRAADQAGLDFTQFDADGDGVIDNIFIYYAGYNEAEFGPEESIWPHRSYVQGNIMFDGLRLNNYACSSELKGNSGQQMAAIGTLCHEFAHVLGLPDLYDTNGDTDGKSWGVYNYSLMCSGNYNNESRTPPSLSVVERSMIGWLEPTELTAKGNYSLRPLSNNEAYYYTTDAEGEIFMLENRQWEKWDMPLPGHGLLIYHIDRSQRMVAGRTAASHWDLANNSVNNVASHPCLEIIPANGIYGPPDGGGSGIFFPGSTGVTRFTADGTPSSRPWSGIDLKRDLTEISESGGIIRFSYSGGANVPVEEVTLEPAEVELNLLSSVQLTANIYPTNALNKTCDWYSSNRNIVSVNENGIAKGIAVGEAEITVITRDGGFQAKCKIKVTQNFARQEQIRVTQRDIWLSWESNPEVRKWKVKWKKTSAADYTVAEADSSLFRISGLQPSSSYKVQLVAEKEEEAIVLEQEVTTDPITAPFAAIGGIKGKYVAGETLWLTLVNVQTDIVSENWTIDGKPLFIGREIKPEAGEHEIRVTVKDKSGTTETIVRKITIQSP